MKNSVQNKRSSEQMRGTHSRKLQFSVLERACCGEVRLDQSQKSR